LLNFNRDDGETILKPQGWYNGIDAQDAAGFTANQLTLTHDDFKALTPEKQEIVRGLRNSAAEHAGGVSRTLCFVPHIEVFHLNKLLIPNVQLGIHLYFNPPTMRSIQYAGATAFRLNPDDIKVKLYLCQVRLDGSIYRSLMSDMNSGKKVVSYPTVRSEIRTYNITRNTLHDEISNPFQNRLPNMIIVALVSSTAFNGHIGHHPFAFKTFNLKGIKQTVRGETYPYEMLELVHDKGSEDLKGYRQFLQATDSLCKSRGNMVRAVEWGHDKNCTLFVFENVANGCLNTPVLNSKLSGEVRLVLDFGDDQGTNDTAIVYGEFENLMEINSNKTVQYNVYRV